MRPYTPRAIPIDKGVAPVILSTYKAKMGSNMNNPSILTKKIALSAIAVFFSREFRANGSVTCRSFGGSRERPYITILKKKIRSVFANLGGLVSKK